MVEANGNVSVTNKSKATRTDDYVTKPIWVDALLQALLAATPRPEA